MDEWVRKIVAPVDGKPGEAHGRQRRIADAAHVTKRQFDQLGPVLLHQLLAQILRNRKEDQILLLGHLVPHVAFGIIGQDTDAHDEIEVGVLQERIALEQGPAPGFDVRSRDPVMVEDGVEHGAADAHHDADRQLPFANLPEVGDAGRLHRGNHEIARAFDPRDDAQVLERSVFPVGVRAFVGRTDALQLGDPEIDGGFRSKERALGELPVADLGRDEAP